MTRQDFGKLPDGTPVEIFTLTNKNGAEARIMTYGATVVSLRVPDRDGHLADVVLGYDGLDGYVKRGNYFGCIAPLRQPDRRSAFLARRQGILPG